MTSQVSHMNQRLITKEHIATNTDGKVSPRDLHGKSTFIIEALHLVNNLQLVKCLLL